MSRQVELELVKYRLPDIEHASVELASMFAKYSGIVGTRHWINSLSSLYFQLRNAQNKEWILNSRGVELTFTGFPNPIPVIENGALVYRSREPRFIIEEAADLRPRERTQVAKVTEEIVMEMNEVYLLEVDMNPTTLVFPKEVYAEVERINAVML